jgi:hypothetical protein
VGVVLISDVLEGVLDEVFVLEVVSALGLDPVLDLVLEEALEL